MDLTQALYETLLQTLYASGAMLLIALIVLLVYSRSPGSKKREIKNTENDKNEAYLGGEEHPYDQESMGSTNFFWSIVNQSLRNVYDKIVDRFHTYSIDSWLLYMSAWLAFLVILLIILVGIL